MPPAWNWYRGREDFAAFMGRIFRARGREWRTDPLWANGEAGFASYSSGELRAVQLITSQAGRVTRLTVFQDEAVFGLFALDR